MYTIKIFHSSGILLSDFNYESYNVFTACYLGFTVDNSKEVIFYEDNDDKTEIHLQYKKQ